MADDLEAALAWADEDRVLNDVTHTRTLAAAVREVRGRVCGNCRYQAVNPEPTYDVYAYCGRLPVSCANLGNVCGAWAATEQA